jgi:hypothetical protein
MEGVRLVRAADVAELYGVDESTVHRWERAGRLRPARRDPGGAKYWLDDELLADLTAPPPAQPAAAEASQRVATLVEVTRRPRRRAG